MIIFADAQTTDMAESYGLHSEFLTDHLRYCLGVKQGVVSTFHPYEEGLLPDLSNPDIDGVVLGGSAFMVDDELPWQPAFEAWVKDAITRQIPILAYCYGHQTVAKILGGTVAADPNGREVGITHLEQTAAGKKHFALRGVAEQFILPVSHLQSVLKAPKDAVLLADHPRHPNHILTYSDKLVTIQAEICYDRIWAHGLVHARKERYYESGMLKDEDDFRALVETIDANIVEAARNGQLIARNFLQGPIKTYMKARSRDVQDLLVVPFRT